jgi:hypothetical protein
VGAAVGAGSSELPQAARLRTSAAHSRNVNNLFIGKTFQIDGICGNVPR